MNKKLSVALATSLLATNVVWAQADSSATSSPKYKADAPESVLTPDLINTKSLGELKFFDGMPDKDTVAKVFDYIDTARGVETFLNGIPISSIHALHKGMRDMGVKPLEVVVFEELMDARTLYLTPNTTTMYVFTQVDLSQGPVVGEIPPGVLGLMDDAGFRYVTDFGLVGPDKGKGGKYLLLPPDYEGDVPEGYFVARSKTYNNWVAIRAFVEKGDIAATVSNIKDNTRFYLLSQKDSPSEQVFHNLSGKQYNTVHSNNFEFYEELNTVIQKEPEDAFSAELTGLFASIGIKKGQAFEPDERMKKILTEAAAIGNATARATSFSPRSKSVYFYDDRQWNSPFAGGSHEFYNKGERVLDDRSYFHYVATGITPAMVTKDKGKGSAYLLTAKDSSGDYLDGSKSYTINLPKDVPAKQFWSFMVYSGQHRSMLETDQKSPGVDSLNESLVQNDDGTYTIYFGPEKPEGNEENWIQTMPGKSFNVIFRLYGPLDSWFDKSWRPGDFEVVG